MMMNEKVEVSDKILGSGGFADVRCGVFAAHPVAVKTMRIAAQDNLDKIRKVSASDIFSATWDAISSVLPQQFCKEVVLWSTLSHPNVLKLAGVHGDMEKGQFITVSELMMHGNIMQYIVHNHANRLELVRDLTFSTASFTEIQ